MPLPSSTGDIAIIGMSCRVAGAESPSELWDLLAMSRDVRKEIDRFNSAGYYKANGAKRKGLTNVRHAYLMDQGIDRFDNGYFSVPASEAVAMDPQQRMLLELSYEAVENAGVPLKDFQGTNTAVYCGEYRLSFFYIRYGFPLQAWAASLSVFYKSLWRDVVRLARHGRHQTPRRAMISILRR